MAPHRARRVLFGSAGLLVFFGVAGGLALPGGLELRITPVGGGPPLFMAPLEPGERFTLRYVHSVDHEPIWEVHSVDEQGRIFVEEERFVMVGAGMGDLPGRGHWTGSDGLQAIEAMHYPIGSFVLRVGSPGVDHTILWRGTETSLTSVAAGMAVRVGARPVNRLYRLWRGLWPPETTPKAREHARG